MENTPSPATPFTALVMAPLPTTAVQFVFRANAENSVFARVVGYLDGVGVAEFDRTGMRFAFTISGESRYVAARDQREASVTRFAIDTVADADGVIQAAMGDRYTGGPLFKVGL